MSYDLLQCISYNFLWLFCLLSVLDRVIIVLSVLLILLAIFPITMNHSVTYHCWRRCRVSLLTKACRCVASFVIPVYQKDFLGSDVTMSLLLNFHFYHLKLSGWSSGGMSEIQCLKYTIAWLFSSQFAWLIVLFGSPTLVRLVSKVSALRCLICYFAVRMCAIRYFHVFIHIQRRWT